MTTPLAQKRKLAYIIIASFIAISVIQIVYELVSNKPLFSNAKMIVITFGGFILVVASIWWANQRYDGYEEDEKKYDHDIKQKSKKFDLKYGKTVSRFERISLSIGEFICALGFIGLVLLLLFDTESIGIIQIATMPLLLLTWSWFRSIRLQNNQTEEGRKKDPLNIRKHLDKLQK